MANVVGPQGRVEQLYTLTVKIDSREKQALPFPDHIKVHLRRSKTATLIKIKKEVDTLKTGDYTLLGFERVCLIETKRSAQEVYENLLTGDFRRSSRAFERLSSECKHPVLVCEFSQCDLFKDEYPGLPDALAWAVAHYGLGIWFAGPRSGVSARAKTADCALRLMIAAVELEYPNFLHGDS